MTSLKQKTVNGLFWSIIENFANKGLLFIVGLVLARLLSPSEFGLIGMITIFIAISQSLVDSGFKEALIRRVNANDTDFSTVFLFNLSFAVIIYLILFFSASSISRFFNEPQLTSLVKVLSLNVIINSFGIVQMTKLIRTVNFKLLTKISIIAGILSGFIAILLAYQGWGVWSLVIKTTSFNLITVLCLYSFSNWMPKIRFSYKSFKDMFRFGYKLVISGLIDTIYRNVYYLIIGKYFSAADLGYYTRAEQFNNLPSSNITSVIQRVTYPVLSQIQQDKIKLREAYRKIIKSTMLISFVLMLSLAAIAEPLVITLIGEKWRPSIVILQMLCFAGMIYPLHGLNLNILKVSGRSDLLLKLEVIKKTLAVPTILVGVYFGMKVLILGLIINSFIAYFLNSYWSGKLINYSSKNQIFDLIPSFFLAVISAAIIFLVGLILPLSFPIILVIQIVTGGIIVLALCELTNLDSYVTIKKVALDKFKIFLKRN